MILLTAAMAVTTSITFSGSAWSGIKTRWADEDPHADDPGSYFVPAYDLLESCEGFDPTGLLVYVPSLGVYGTHDCDHEDMRIFPRLTWWNIVADPPLYLNALWYHQRCVGTVVNPVGKFEFRLET